MVLALSSKNKELLLEYLALDTSFGKNITESFTIFDSVLTNLGFVNELISIPKEVAPQGRVNLVAKQLNGEELPYLIIYNHIDIVSPDYKDALNPKITEDKVFARGTADNKGGTIACIEAFERLKGKAKRFNIIFLLTTDEETNQVDQLEYLFGIIDFPKNTLLFDTDTFAGGVTVARLDRANITLELKGHSAHSAMSHLGKNAVEDGIRLCNYLLEVKEELVKRGESGIPPFPFMGTAKVEPRLNINVFTGGDEINVVPDSCTIRINTRFVPEMDGEAEHLDILHKIKAFCESHGIEYEIVENDLIHGVLCKHKEAEVLSEIYKKHAGESGLYCGQASNPLIDLARRLNLSHFGLGLFRKDTNIHSENEFFYIKDFNNLTATLEDFLQ